MAKETQEVVEKKHLETWNKVKTPPKEALKEIKGGRLKGFSDIDPMWRMQIMTETFGPVGIGWTYEIMERWSGAYGDQVCVFQNIRLKYKQNNEWSEWIPGTGGSMLAAQETRGIHVSDECYKMALTDALSVAMKAIGVGADVYMGKVSHKGGKVAPQSKYLATQPSNDGQQTGNKNGVISAGELKKLESEIGSSDEVLYNKVTQGFKVGSLAELKKTDFKDCLQRVKEYKQLKETTQQKDRSKS